jgi:hypothetical protein
MRPARVAAVLTWSYAAGFGVPAIPVALYLRKNGTLPTFMDLFPMYGGPWFTRLDQDTFIALLMAYLLILLAVAWVAWRGWLGSRTAMLAGLALLPVEAVFWMGFALPVPWVFGVARAGLLAVALRNRPARTSG